jgi:CheY-like chemotaxis protein
MNCPRCKSPVGALESPDAIVTCPGCGTRLMTRSAALRSQGGKQPAPDSATIAVPPAQPTAPGLPPAAHPLAPLSHQTAVKVGRHTISGKSTGGAARAGGRRAEAKPSGLTLEMLLAEIQAVRDTQQLILEALGSLRVGPAASAGAVKPAADGRADDTPHGGTTLSAIRAASRKSAVLVDDNTETRQAAVAELERADIPVRAFTEGNKALAAIAQEKPDVIILELAVTGELAGKDLVNMIKATMEWVDIPIVLWTRENVSNQREARQLHGADEVVPKSAGAAALVARVITVFRR